MAQLKIDKNRYTSGMDMVKITGLTDAELSELKSMEHNEAREKLLEMLDTRNNGIGTTWACGYGVYGMWFDNDAAYMNVGVSSD